MVVTTKLMVYICRYSI